MALFNKNPNETEYVGGRKHWTDVIKNSGAGELLIWRQPEEDFNTNSTLIVMPGEEAIFIKGGTVEQVFDEGTYKLTTENYPFISRLRNAFSGGISTFNCVVYFVRVAHSMEIYWGTDSPIQVRDKLWGVVTNVRSRGSYKVQITNPVMFLEKLLGNNIPYASQDELNDYFANQFQSKIKTVLSKALNSLQTELIGIESYLEEFSDEIEPMIDEILNEYGLKCVKFVVSACEVDKSKYDSIDEAQIEANKKILAARGDKTVLGILGDDWGKLKAADILGNLSKNEGAGGVAAAGAGVGMGMVASGVFGNLADHMFSSFTNTQNSNQTVQSQNAADRFAIKEEPSQRNDSNDPRQALRELKNLRDEGFLSEEEYEAKRKEIIARL